MAADRLAMLKMQEDYINNPNFWWNKLANITEEEFNLMPMGFIKKYGSYISNIARYDKEFKMEENKTMNDYFTQVKHLKKL